MAFQQLVERLPDSTFFDLTTQPLPVEEDWEEAPGTLQHGSQSAPGPPGMSSGSAQPFDPALSGGPSSSSSGPSRPVAAAPPPSGDHPEAADGPAVAEDDVMEEPPPMDTPFAGEPGEDVPAVAPARRRAVR